MTDITFQIGKKIFQWDSDKAKKNKLKHIGKVDEILFVIYTERGDITRIISARKATARERRIYNDSKENY